MTDLIGYVIRGIPFGCVFALVAIGLVLTYKTSGVFNLAFAAQAFVSAAVYYQLRVEDGWPNVPAFLVAVVVVAPLLGLVLERLIFRHLRTAPAVAKLVASLGLLVALPEIVNLWIGSEAKYGVPTIWPNQFGIYRWGDYAIDGNEAATVIATVVSVVALTLLFRYSSIGLRMRAVVESPRMTALAGINSDRVERVLLDALELVRRPRRRADGAALHAAVGQQLHDPARRGDRGGGVRPALEHSDGAARWSAARHPPGDPRRLPPAEQRHRQRAAAVAAVRAPVPAAPLLAGAAPAAGGRRPALRRRPAAARARRAGARPRPDHRHVRAGHGDRRRSSSCSACSRSTPSGS